MKTPASEPEPEPPIDYVAEKKKLEDAVVHHRRELRAAEERLSEFLDNQQRREELQQQRRRSESSFEKIVHRDGNGRPEKRAKRESVKTPKTRASVATNSRPEEPEVQINREFKEAELPSPPASGSVKKKPEPVRTSAKGKRPRRNGPFSDDDDEERLDADSQQKKSLSLPATHSPPPPATKRYFRKKPPGSVRRRKRVSLVFDSDTDYSSEEEVKEQSTCPGTASSSTMPSGRLDYPELGSSLDVAIAAIPAPSKPFSLPPSERYFSRDYISTIIGGQGQGTWPTPSRLRKAEFSYWTGPYVRLQRDLNPFLPAAPGLAGCMFLCGTNGGEGEYPVFIMEDSSQWRYHGTYRTHALQQLPRSEWRALLTSDMRERWCKHLLEQVWGYRTLAAAGILTPAQAKARAWKKDRDWHRLMDFFEAGDDAPVKLRLLVRRMEPLSYDHQLYRALERDVVGWVNPKKGRVCGRHDSMWTPTNATRRGKRGKRKRVADNYDSQSDDEEAKEEEEEADTILVADPDPDLNPEEEE